MEAVSTTDLRLLGLIFTLSVASFLRRSRMASQKNKTFFIEHTDFALRILRLGSSGQGQVIEEVRETTSGTASEVKAFVQEFARVKSGQLVRARCGVYPDRRLLRSASLKDAAKPGDPRALEEVVRTQLRVNPADFLLTALNAEDGTEFNSARPARELFVCGAPRADFKQAQDFLVEAGIYPLRLELGSVAAAGFFLKALQAQQVNEPVLIVELGESTSHVFIFNKNRLDSARPLSLGLNSMVGGVREELGLKDEGAARRLFFSDSFDFREMGPRLVERLLRELRSMTGFYEVETGQSISRMLCTLLPSKLKWLDQTFASALGMDLLEIDAEQILAPSGVTAAADAPGLNGGIPHGLLGLMINQEI